MPLGDVQVGDVWSREVQDTFRLFVGRCGDQPEAVLFVADANGLFGLALDTVRLMQLPALVPAMLLVGVGYPTSRTIADTMAIRVRDLTPTTSTPFPGSGGADAFLRFLRNEVFPWLERDHPACLARSMYFGHSLGGLLGVHALLSDPPTFDHLILSSPSLWWDHHRVFEHEQERARVRDDLAATVFFGIGADETDEGRRREAAKLPDGHPLKPPRTHLDMVDDLARFVDALRRRGYPSLELEAIVFPDEYHVTVPGTVLSHGLRHTFERDRPEPRRQGVQERYATSDPSARKPRRS
jgi:predicted alpha/beta superfamily hydrolase